MSTAGDAMMSVRGQLIIYPTVLMIFLLYCTHPGALQRHYPGCNSSILIRKLPLYSSTDLVRCHNGHKKAILKLSLRNCFPVVRCNADLKISVLKATIIYACHYQVCHFIHFYVKTSSSLLIRKLPL